jgi:hypothetical protein
MLELQSIDSCRCGLLSLLRAQRITYTPGADCTFSAHASLRRRTYATRLRPNAGRAVSLPLRSDVGTNDGNLRAGRNPDAAHSAGQSLSPPPDASLSLLPCAQRSHAFADQMASVDAASTSEAVAQLLQAGRLPPDWRTLWAHFQIWTSADGEVRGFESISLSDWQPPSR